MAIWRKARNRCQPQSRISASAWARLRSRPSCSAEGASGAARDVGAGFIGQLAVRKHRAGRAAFDVALRAQALEQDFQAAWPVPHLAQLAQVERRVEPVAPARVQEMGELRIDEMRGLGNQR